MLYKETLFLTKIFNLFVRTMLINIYVKTYLSESPYTKTISDGVLRLQEKGVLTQLKNKWWKKMHVPKEPCVSVFY